MSGPGAPTTTVEPVTATELPNSTSAWGQGPLRLLDDLFFARTFSTAELATLSVERPVVVSKLSIGWVTSGVLAYDASVGTAPTQRFDVDFFATTVETKGAAGTTTGESASKSAPVSAKPTPIGSALVNLKAPGLNGGEHDWGRALKAQLTAVMPIAPTGTGSFTGGKSVLKATLWVEHGWVGNQINARFIVAGPNGANMAHVTSLDGGQWNLSELEVMFYQGATSSSPRAYDWQLKKVWFPHALGSTTINGVAYDVIELTAFEATLTDRVSGQVANKLQ